MIAVNLSSVLHISQRFHPALAAAKGSVIVVSSVGAFQATLGSYDYWAIEYAYKPIAADGEKAGPAVLPRREGEQADDEQGDGETLEVHAVIVGKASAGCAAESA